MHLHCLRRLAFVAITSIPLLFTCAFGQSSPTADTANVRNAPGDFDYFLLDMPWGPVFCTSIKDVSAQCRPQAGFVVHGLWPQNNNGTWPEFCSHSPGPRDLTPNLDITPDIALLQHEWAKHGTCSGLTPAEFFRAEHEAFAQIQTPTALIDLNNSRTFTPLFVLDMFYVTNPGFPPGSFSLSCKNGHVIAVEACFSKSLQPIACQGLKTCSDQTVTFDPLRPTITSTQPASY